MLLKCANLKLDLLNFIYTGKVDSAGAPGTLV